jgi:hypothetical protein
MPAPWLHKLGGLFSEPQVQGGIFGDGPAMNAYDPRMAFATELLSQSGYAPYKRPFGELLGAALQQAQKARALGISQQQQEEQRKAQQELIAAQTANAQREIVPAGATVFENGQPKYTAPKEVGASGEAGSLQEIDRINAYRKTQGQPPIDPEEYLSQRRGASADSQLYAQYVTGAVARGEKPLSIDQFLVRFRGDVSGSQQGAEEIQKRRFVQVDEGQRAADSLPTIRRAIELVDTVGTGKPAEVALAFKNAFGVTGADEGELSANLGKAVLSQLRATFGAQFTAQEGDRLADIESGFGKSTETNKRLLQQAAKLVERVARRGIDAARAAGNEFDAKEIEKALDFTLSNPDGGMPKRVKVDANGDVIGD